MVPFFTIHTQELKLTVPTNHKITSLNTSALLPGSPGSIRCPLVWSSLDLCPVARKGKMDIAAPSPEHAQACTVHMCVGSRCSCPMSHSCTYSLDCLFNVYRLAHFSCYRWLWAVGSSCCILVRDLVCLCHPYNSLLLRH